MTLSKIWVYAEADEGKVSTITLELLAKARELADTVEAVYGGADADAIAGELGEHGATAVHTTGDLGGSLPGVPVSSAIAAAVEAGNGPDALLIGTNYDGRDVAGRLSAKLDVPVVTNVVDLELDGDALVGTEPIFGGTTNVKTKATNDGLKILLVRPKSFVAEPSGGGAASVSELSVPDTGATGTARITNRYVEEASGPKLDEAAIVVSVVGAWATPRSSR